MRALLPRFYAGFTTTEPTPESPRTGVLFAVWWLGLHFSLGGGVGEPR